MNKEQQGLYMLTVMCSLISLLASCFLLITVGITKLWKSSSMRLVIYLTISNVVMNLNLLMPTYSYEFMCAFQAHLLNFTLFTQLIWAPLLMHYTYLKVVEEKKFERIYEVRYLMIVLIPSLVTSLPPFLEHNIGGCWEDDRSPLSDIVSSYSYIILYLIGALFSFAMLLGVISYMKLYDKGYFTQDYIKKVDKISLIARYSCLMYVFGAVIFIYAATVMVNRKKRAFDFIAMFIQSSYGAFMLLLFLSSKKVKVYMKNHFQTQEKTTGMLEEDRNNFSSFSEAISQDISD